MNWNELQGKLVVDTLVEIEDDHGTMMDKIRGRVQKISWENGFPLITIDRFENIGETNPILPNLMILDFRSFNDSLLVQLPNGNVRFMPLFGPCGNFIFAELEPVVFGIDHRVPKGELDMSTLEYK